MAGTQPLKKRKNVHKKVTKFKRFQSDNFSKCLAHKIAAVAESNRLASYTCLRGALPGCVADSLALSLSPFHSARERVVAQAEGH